jgi:hypothetical protein
MALFIRFFVIMFGLFLGSVAAGATFLATISGFTVDIDPPHSDIFFFWVFLWTSLTWSTLVMIWSFIPACVAILIAEIFAIRSLLVYAVFGAIGGAIYGLGFLYGTDNAIQSAAAAGIAGASVYWLVAGRNAGTWHSPSTSAGENI